MWLSKVSRFTLLLWMGMTILSAVSVWSEAEDPFSLKIKPPVEILHSTDRSFYRLDEQISFSLVVRWSQAGYDIRYRLPALPLVNLALVETTQTAETVVEKGRPFYQKKIHFLLKPLREGSASIGAFSFEYGLADSAQTEKVTIPPTVFQVRKVPFYRNPKSALGASVFAVFAMAIFACLKFLLGKQADMKADNRGNETLEDECLNQLSRSSPLLERNETREFLARAGGIFREYLVRKLDLQASRLAGLEIAEVIERRRDIAAEERKKIRILMEHLSESRFGGVVPSKEEAREIQDKIRGFILQKKVI